MNDHGLNAGSWNEADTCRKFVVPKLQAAGNSMLLNEQTAWRGEAQRKLVNLFQSQRYADLITFNL